MKVYIAGPYTAETKEDVMDNVEYAIAVGNAIGDLGHTPFIPHLCHFWDERHSHDYEYWMDYCFEWIPSCDVILAIEPSPGVNREVELAEELGMPIYGSINEFIECEITHELS